jgi:signal transduction histidine kinase
LTVLPQSVDARFPFADRGWAGAWFRRAFAGVTGKVLAVAFAVLALRTLETNIDELLLDPEVVRAWHKASRAHSWVVRFLTGLAWLLVMAVPMIVAILSAANLGPQHGNRRVAALAAAVVVSTGFGILLRMSLQDWVIGSRRLEDIATWLPALWVRYALIAGVLTAAAEFIRRESGNLAAARHAELDAAKLDREMAETRLQLLHAQIEPHFLFNTLANLRRLYRSDPVAARDMLDDLMRYFAVALPSMRDAESSLARDAMLIDAYLRVHRIRMGVRLAYELDIPRELGGCAVPSMMLMTLVENAIKHGLNPLPDGGSLRVAARRVGEWLALSVADTGAGFRRDSGTGTGLANIRTRLSVLFGRDASLSIEENRPAGCVVTIMLPFAAAAT